VVRSCNCSARFGTPCSCSNSCLASLITISAASSISSSGSSDSLTMLLEGDEQSGDIVSTSSELVTDGGEGMSIADS